MPKRLPWEPIWKNTPGGWYVDFTAKGCRVRKSLGLPDTGQYALARTIAKKLYEKTIMEVMEQENGPDSINLSEATESYIQDGGSKRFLLPVLQYFGPNTDLHEIREADLIRGAEIVYPNCSPATRLRQFITPMRAIINHANGKRRYEFDKTARKRWLTPEEAERLLAAATDEDVVGAWDPERRIRQIIAVSLGSGGAPGEIVALNVGHLNRRTQEIRFETSRKGNARLRWVWMPARTWSLLHPIPITGRAFLTPSGEPYEKRVNRGGQYTRNFKKVRVAAGLGDDVTPYVLRHTWATWYYAMTQDFRRLMAYGGWSKVETALGYTKLAPRDLPERLLTHGWDFSQDSVNRDASGL